ncbi:MAG: LON peptidase substrate-binding domain-containing protein [Acidimicrobiales bacterium]
MFPLGTVLLPTTYLPLHVFEPRYRALTGWCLERDRRLGVVLIARGSEVGGGDVRYGIGTAGRIVDSAALPDGRWLLTVQGERRIRVREWLAEDPFPQADVEYLDDTGADALDPSGRARLVRRTVRAVDLLEQLGDWPPYELRPELDPDPVRAAWQAAGFGLLGPADCQRLLEVDHAGERLDLLVSLLDEAIEVLALRAAER